MTAKKQKLVDLTKEEKGKVRRITLMTIVGVAIVCVVLVGCFACKQDSGQPSTNLTAEQKALYWKAQISGISWAPQTDATNDGILDGLFIARDAKTELDPDTGFLLIYFMINDSAVFDTASIVLESESGTIKLSNDDIWTVKFSEKNDIRYMTIKDTNGKTVYYQEK